MIYAPNADYNLYALNLRGELQVDFCRPTSPSGGRPSSDGTNVYFGTLGRKVYAVNAQTGKQAWVQKVDGAVLGSPVLGTNNTLYVGSYGGTVYALNTANGATRCFSQGFFLDLVRSGRWMAIRSIMGMEKDPCIAHPVGGTGQSWSQPLNGAIIGTPLVSGDNIVVGTEAGNVYFIDRYRKESPSIFDLRESVLFTCCSRGFDPGCSNRW